MESLVVVTVLGVGGLLVVAAVVAIAVAAGARGAGPSPSEAAAAARRHAGAVTALAWFAAVVVSLVAGPLLARTSSGDVAGVVVGLVPTLAGLTYVGVHAIGEVTWPRPTGAVRRAALQRRTLRDVAPRVMSGAVAVWLGALALVALLGSLTAAPDGRSVEWTFARGSSSASPYPGWHFSVPLLVGGLVVVGAAVLVLRLVASRPAVVDAAPEWDLRMRSLSAHRVLRGVQLALGLTLAGQLLMAGIALSGVASTHPAEGLTAPAVYRAAAIACLVLALVAAVATFVLAGIPGPVPPAPRPDVPAAGPLPHHGGPDARTGPAAPGTPHGSGTATGPARPDAPASPAAPWDRP